MNEKESRPTVAGLVALAMHDVAAAYRAPTHLSRIVTQAAPSKLPAPLLARTETVWVELSAVVPVSAGRTSRKRPFKTVKWTAGKPLKNRRTSAPPERARGRSRSSRLNQVLTVTPDRLRSPPHPTRPRFAPGSRPASHETLRSAQWRGTGQTAYLHRDRLSHRSARRRRCP